MNILSVSTVYSLINLYASIASLGFFDRVTCAALADRIDPTPPLQPQSATTASSPLQPPNFRGAQISLSNRLFTP